MKSSIQTDLFATTPEQTLDDGWTWSCISLWQPWASLIAVKAKTVETRDWAPPAALVGQRLAIHAAKTRQGMIQAQGNKPLWARCLELLPWDDDGNLPFGAVVAHVRVAGVKSVRDLTPDLFGNYLGDRLGWLLEDIQPLARPIPLKGRQGIFMERLPLDPQRSH